MDNLSLLYQKKRERVSFNAGPQLFMENLSLSLSEREIKKEFQLMADTAESSECSMSVCLPGRSMYRSGGDLVCDDDYQRGVT